MTLTRIPSDRRNVFFDHDGSVDDLLSLLLLVSMEDIEIAGVSITPADCYPEYAFETTWKLLRLTNKSNVEIGIGDFYGINAFPSAWRAKPKILNAFPDLINFNMPDVFGTAPEAVELMLKKLTESETSVTIMLTGPCSNLVKAIKKHPSILNKIEHVVWMAGAVDVPGNVVTYNHRGTAEWNVFWDPVSASELLKYDLNISIVPLDVTNRVPVTFDFLKQLSARKSSFFCNLACQFWATTVDTIPSYDYIYFMWDVLATSYLAIPEIFKTEKLELDIVPTGYDAGRTYRKKNCGQWVNVVKEVNLEKFYSYIVNQFEKMEASQMNPAIDDYLSPFDCFSGSGAAR